MVGQANPMKTSSDNSQPIHGSLFCDWRLPETADVEERPGIFGNIILYAISGSIGTASADCRGKKPHMAFANLPTTPSSEADSGPLVDPKAMKKFIKQYGPLSTTTDTNYKDWFERGSLYLADRLKVVEEYAERTSESDWKKAVGEALAAADRQDLLRYAWRTTDPRALEEIERRMDGIKYEFERGRLQVKVKNVWSLICFLFLQDHGAGKIAVCENPDCPTPYFVKKRSTQKVCEAGDCSAWAQREYSLKSWRKKHQKKKTKLK